MLWYFSVCVLVLVFIDDVDGQLRQSQALLFFYYLN